MICVFHQVGVHWESAGSLVKVCMESAWSPPGVHWEFIKWSLQKSSPNKVTKLQTGWVCWEPSRSLLGVCWDSDFPIEYYQLPKQFFKWTLKIGFPKKLSKWALQIETCLEFAGSLVEVWWKSGGSPLGVRWKSMLGAHLSNKWFDYFSFISRAITTLDCNFYYLSDCNIS